MNLLSVNTHLSDSSLWPDPNIVMANVVSFNYNVHNTCIKWYMYITAIITLSFAGPPFFAKPPLNNPQNYSSKTYYNSTQQ